MPFTNRVKSFVLIRKERILDFLFVVSDAASVFSAFLVAFTLRLKTPVIENLLDAVPFFHLTDINYRLFHLRTWENLVSTLVFALFYYALNSLQFLYHGYRLLRRPKATPRIFLSNFILFLAITTLSAFSKEPLLPRSYILLFYGLNIFFTLFFRCSIRAILRFIRKKTDALNTPCVIVGDTKEGRAIRKFLETYKPHGNVFLDLVPSESVTSSTERFREYLETVGRPDGKHVPGRSVARCVFIADPSLSLNTIMSLLSATSAYRNIACRIAHPVLTMLAIKIRIPCDDILGTPCFHFDAFDASLKSSWWRILISRALAAVALVCLSPVFLLVALAIKLDDGGPVFFRQIRYGINRREFKMFKFRTMCVNAEAMQAALESKNEMGRGGLFKIKNDPRLTKIGAFLRKTSIDEFPQFINVLLGDMRVVGPRPLPTRDLENYFRIWHFDRHLGYPGITCLWQASGRSTLDFETMCALDIYYVRNSCWPLDVIILFQTALGMLNGPGAY